MRFKRQLVALTIVAWFLFGCQLPFLSQAIATPKAEPASPAAVPPGKDEPEITASPGAITREPDLDSAGPPTAAPLSLGPVGTLESLPAGSDLIITEISMINGTEGWAIGGAGQAAQRLLRTENGGMSWREVTPPVRNHVLSLNYQLAAEFISAEQVQVFRYEPAERGAVGRSEELVIWRTEDGGANWSASQPVAVPFIAVEGAEPYWEYGTSDVGWILARQGGVGMHQYPVALIKTEDAGASWQLQHSPFETPDAGLTGCTKSGMDFNGLQVGMLTISDCPYEQALVLTTEDSGVSWQAHLLPAPQGFEAEYKQAAGGGCSSHSPLILSEEIWRVGVLCRLFEEDERRLPFLYITEDGGDSWQAWQIPDGQISFLSPDQGWILGRQIYRSDDSGRSWQFVKEVNWQGQFSFVDMQRGWAVARAANGEVALVVTQDGAETWQIIRPVTQ